MKNLKKGIYSAHDSSENLLLVDDRSYVVNGKWRIRWVVEGSVACADQYPDNHFSCVKIGEWTEYKRGRFDIDYNTILEDFRRSRNLEANK